MAKFILKSDYQPRGDQPQAIEELSAGILRGDKHQVLLGVTGSGKTFTMANVVEKVQRPTLVLAHNKTLAAQLYGEFKELFPDNAVEYFVSYYDYYQPEAYVASTDTFIEKDSSINEEIDKMRHSATRSLLSRSDVLIVSSVSCIYGLGSPEAYFGMLIRLAKQGCRSTAIPCSSNWWKSNTPVTISTFIAAPSGCAATRWKSFLPMKKSVPCASSFSVTRSMPSAKLIHCAAKCSTDSIIPPSSPPAITLPPVPTLDRAIRAIQDELRERITWFRDNNMLVEAQRIEQRTMFDIEMMEEMGYCQGIENYSRFLDNRHARRGPGHPVRLFP